MSPFELPTTGKSADWPIFTAMLLAMGLPIAGFVVWLAVFRKAGAKRRKKRKHRHRSATNPTLAEAGGLPPRRDPNVPPRGV